MRRADDRLSSARLQLRRYTAADLEALNQLNSDPAVMRHMGGPASRADTEAMLRDRILSYYEQHPGLGIWVTEERDSGRTVGMHLLNHIRGEAHIQVGYRLYPAYWGKGYATEMTQALLRYGFEQLALPRIVAITDLANVESQHVLLKSGLIRDGERYCKHPSYGTAPLAWFWRDRETWLRQHPQGNDC